MLEDTVKRANDGVSAHPIISVMIFRTYSSTYFVFKGTSRHSEEWYLCNNNGKILTKGQSSYSTEEGGQTTKMVYAYASPLR